MFCYTGDSYCGGKALKVNNLLKALGYIVGAICYLGMLLSTLSVVVLLTAIVALIILPL